MYDYTKRAAAPLDSVVKEAWNYSPTSSSGQKVLAALKAYGLVEDAQEKGSIVALKLTQRAIHILLEDQDTPERRGEIKKAALSPKWYEYCWKTWGKEMPPAMKSNLLIHHGFVDSTIEGFLKDYRKTMAFAGLLDDVIFSKTEEEIEESDTGPKIGDYVQWELKGILQMPEARKLLRIETHGEQGEYGVLEGYLGGIPYKELIRAEPPVQESKTNFQPPNIFPPPPMGNVAPAIVPPSRGQIKMETESFSLSNGLSAQFQWPSVISEAAFKRFEYFLEGVKMSVKQAISNDPGPETEPKDERVP
ncbi:MAG: hypothetical protein ACLQHF_17620 [Terracidiphilus sp.]